jgi:hypothetical protein
MGMKNRSHRSLRAPRPLPELPGFVQLDVAGVTLGWSRTTPLGADERRWLERACALSFAATVEIHGAREERLRLHDVLIVGRAAEQLWQGTGGAPAWAQLDVEELLARLDDELTTFADAAALTLTAFFTWMRVHGHLSAADHLTLQRRLDAQAGHAQAVGPWARRRCPGFSLNVASGDVQGSRGHGA